MNHLTELASGREKEDMARPSEQALVNEAATHLHPPGFDHSRVDDVRWQEDGIKNDWRLPFKRAWPLRMPVVRHIRAMLIAIGTERHYRRWAMIGAIGRSGYDEWVTYAVARGWA
jgi:hypothetical protein